MNNKKLFISTMLLCGIANASLADDVYVDLGMRGVSIPSSMYGIFFEEINHAGDGGLYAELLQNRGFEEQVVPTGCTLKDGVIYAPHSLNYYYNGYSDLHFAWDVNAKKFTGWTFANSNCSVSKDVVTPDVSLNANTPNALKFVISNVKSGAKADVINTGYWGVAVKSGAKYKVRFFLRTADYAGTVKAVICNSAGTDIGSKAFDVKNDGTWTEYTTELTASETVNNGTFHLQFSSAGTIYVDYVSLFPEDTYKGRENGVRKDLAEFVGALKPKFMRWPGGCIVEGITLGNRVKWKETLGDPVQRKGEFSYWGYRSSWGLGYYEYLQLCEDMGMDAMFVGNVGLACAFRNGDFVEANADSLKSFIQDIDDAIEYAIGDVNTTWGKKRAEAGHPAPFPLKYVELGNENWGQRYADRFAMFYEPLKAKYPQLNFINTLSYDDTWATPIIKKTDYFDVHWYVDPPYFYNNATLFDSKPRGDYKTYAGEYAANDGNRWGTMDDALSEAVFMGGMERNADFVDMASFAPLLLNVNAMSFPCDLIWYDNNKITGRASYYVQKLYSNNKPDFNVKTRMQSPKQSKITEGRVGVGTWATQAEFRNVKVYSNDSSKTYYTSDFVNKYNDWTEGAGTWSITSDGTYKQSSNETPTISLMNAFSFNNSTLEVEAKKVSGAEGFLITFGASTESIGNGYRLNLGGWGNSQAAIEKVNSGAGGVVSDMVPFTLTTGKWYKIKIVMRECKDVSCYVDGKLILTMPLFDILPGRVQAFGGYDKTNGETVIKVVNAVDSIMDATVHINAENIQSEGKVITLSASSLKDENTMEEPTKIAPIEETFNGFAKEFSYKFKPNSLTIFRVKTDSVETKALDIPEFSSSEPTALHGAELALARAKNRLSYMIETAKTSYVESAADATNYDIAISDAQAVMDKTGIGAKDVNNAIAALSKAMTVYYKSQMVAKNEVTSKIKNPNFSSASASGWLGSKPNLAQNVGEFYNTSFNMYQTISGLENGYYLLYMQGFYRDGGPVDVAYSKYNNVNEYMNASLYANSTSVKLRSLFDYTFSFGSWNSYCNWPAEAEQAFNQSADTYSNYLVVKVTNGSMKIGLRKDSIVVCDWCMLNNFRLFYMPIATNINSAVCDMAGTDSIYDIEGRKRSKENLTKKELYIEKGKKKIFK